MVIRVASIARNAFVESIRQPIFLFLIVLSGIAQVLNTWGAGFSMQDKGQSELWGDTKLLFDIGLATIFGCGTLLAAFVATATISREIDNKTILTVVSKPIGRTTVVVGKYLGVTGAIAWAVGTMLVFLLLAVRHGVMSTASDHLDGPVLVFGFSALALSVGLAAWCNFFYGWNFPQTASILIFPTSLIALALVYLINKEWKWQEFGHDFKPKVFLACALLGVALMVLTSVAVAASTRLGQVMTIMACAGVFFLGLLSNHLIGRHAFKNDLIAYVKSAASEDAIDPSFSRLGAVYRIELDGPPEREVRPGDSFYWGPNATGFRLSVPPFPPFEGDAASGELLRPGEPGRIVVTEVSDQTLTIQHAGGSALPVRSPPREGDAVFLTPTRVSPVSLVVWAITPNMHYFWLLDAISQNRTIPAAYVQMVILYSLFLIAAFLALAVALFQRRDVG
jgi:ABC-2 type transport system permease protein